MSDQKDMSFWLDKCSAPLTNIDLITMGYLVDNLLDNFILGSQAKMSLTGIKFAIDCYFRDNGLDPKPVLFDLFS